MWKCIEMTHTFVAYMYVLVANNISFCQCVAAYPITQRIHDLRITFYKFYFILHVALYAHSI